MLKTFTITLLLLICHWCNGQHDIFGKWKTIDDETGEARSVVEIYEKQGMAYGRIVKLFRNKNPDPVCDECPEDDSRYQQKIIGMEIIRGLRPDGDTYSGGTVLKPDDGKIYKCKLWLDGENLLIRGYWGIFYRTQRWVKYE